MASSAPRPLVMCLDGSILEVSLTVRKGVHPGDGQGGTDLQDYRMRDGSEDAGQRHSGSPEPGFWVTESRAEELAGGKPHPEYGLRYVGRQLFSIGKRNGTEGARRRRPGRLPAWFHVYLKTEDGAGVNDAVFDPDAAESVLKDQQFVAMMPLSAQARDSCLRIAYRQDGTVTYFGVRPLDLPSRTEEDEDPAPVSAAKCTRYELVSSAVIDVEGESSMIVSLPNGHNTGDIVEAPTLEDAVENVLEGFVGV